MLYFSSINVFNFFFVVMYLGLIVKRSVLTRTNLVVSHVSGGELISHSRRTIRLV